MPFGLTYFLTIFAVNSSKALAIASTFTAFAEMTSCCFINGRETTAVFFISKEEEEGFCSPRETEF